MQVPQGTKEAQESIKKAKDILIRLKKGSVMLDNAITNDQLTESRKIIAHWNTLSKQLFTELEMTMILQQTALLGKKMAINSKGNIVNVDQMTDEGNLELDPWTLLTLEKLHKVFGEEVNEFIEIKEESSL